MLGRYTQRLVIQGFEVMNRCVRICVGLKIDNEFLRAITVHRPPYAFFHLFPNRRQPTRRVGSKRIHITVSATAVSLTAVTVWTGKVAVHNYLKYTLSSVLRPQVSPVVIISLLSDVQSRTHHRPKIQ